MKLLALALCALATACVIPDEDSPSTTTVTENASGCPIWECNSNSPVINALPFHELNVHGAYNTEGFRIVQFRKSNVTYTPSVQGGRLLGTTTTTTIDGEDLLGASFLIEHSSGTRFILLITGVNSANAYWAKLPPAGSPQPLFESYRFMWTRTIDGVTSFSGRWVNLCSRASADLTGEGIPGEHAVLFEGDRIEKYSKTFLTTDRTIDTQWFNIGCAGHALAKLHLTGHTYAARLAGFGTTTPQRQTMLKMFVADYCGHGYPFTVAGQPLQWKDERGWMTYASPTVYLEARWTPSGAACISRPRVDENPSPDADAQFHDGGATVLNTWLDDPQYCPAKPPTCSDTVPANLDGYHVVSATPPP